VKSDSSSGGSSSSIFASCFTRDCTIDARFAFALVVGFQVEKVTAVSQSKSNNVWI
jgi:hypothetical protein